MAVMMEERKREGRRRKAVRQCPSPV